MRIVCDDLPRTSSANATFSATVLVGSSRKSWKTHPMVRRSFGTCHLLIVLRFLSLTLTTPLVGLSSFSSSRRKVDLPEPDEPMRKTNSPLSICIETSSRAGRGLVG